MFNSWFHIRSMAKFLQTVLPGTIIETCYTHHKNELVIGIVQSHPVSGLRLLFENPLPYMQIETEHREPHRRVPLFKPLSGVQIDQVLWHHSDRQILIALGKAGGYLLFELYGINGNIYILDNQFQVVEPFQKSSRQPRVELQKFTESDSLAISQKDFQRVITANPETRMKALCQQLPIPIYSKTLIREIFFRAELSPTMLAANLSDAQREQLLTRINAVFSEIDKNRYYIYPGDLPLFALIPLRSQETADDQSFDSIITATRQYIATYYRRNQLSQLRRQLSTQLSLALQQLQRKHHKQQKDLDQLPTAAEFRRWADTLLANINQVQGHPENIDLPALDNPDQPVHIPLNPKLSIAENANKFYEKSRQIDSSRAELAASIRNTAEVIEALKIYLKNIADCQDLKTIQKIRKQIPNVYLHQQREADTDERKPYHHFTIQNREILVGRSAKDNDLLSFNHARPNDFWFHAEHGPGSHVVVRNPGKQDALPHDILQIAAGIAAFYSKAKHSTVVPVIYTKKKYIWKRKNMPPGRVFTKFTKSVIVKPLDPRKLS